MPHASLQTDQCATPADKFNCVQRGHQVSRCLHCLRAGQAADLLSERRTHWSASTSTTFSCSRLGTFGSNF